MLRIEKRLASLTQIFVSESLVLHTFRRLRLRLKLFRRKFDILHIIYFGVHYAIVSISIPFAVLSTFLSICVSVSVV